MQHPIYVTSICTPDMQKDFERQVAALYANETTPQGPYNKILHTRTRVHEKEEMRTVKDLTAYLENVSLMAIRCEQFLSMHEHMSGMYTSFKIPKHSGGLRTIDAPSEELKILQRQIVQTLEYIPEQYFPFVHAHDSAYAYVKGRSALDAVKTHQQNGSHWFLKLDIQSFFPTCTTNTIVNLLQQVYPICFIQPAELRLILKCCTLNDVLPQGAVSSPFLTNIMMIPLDKEISDTVFNWNKRRMLYTRYADDLLFSCRESFDWQTIQQKIADIIRAHGFTINQTKTRYGSRAGSNWNLGLMLNKDNQITLGNKSKQRLRAMLFNFLTDANKHIPWSSTDIQYLNGMLSYWRHVEPTYVNTIQLKYETKIGMTYQHAITFNIFDR